MPEEAKLKKTSTKTSGTKVAATKKAPAKKATPKKEAPAENSVAKKPVVNRGMFIDFAPGHKSRVEELNNKLSQQKSPDELPTRRPTPDRPIDRPVVPRPPRSKVPIKRKVGITSGNMPHIQGPAKVVKQTTVIATTDNMPEIGQSKRSLRVAPRRPTPITRSGAVVMPSAPSAGYTGHKNSNIGEDGFFKDSSPLMSDADLAIALAGFADDSEEETSPLTDNLSREAAEFAEEIDALDEVEDVEEISGISDELSRDISDNLDTDVKKDNLTVADAMKNLKEKEQEEEIEDFVTEPKALFGEEEQDEPKKNTIFRSLYDGKSPFLTSVTVEKRPLSGAAPATEVVISGGEVVGGRLAKQAEAAQKEKKPIKLVRKNSPEYRPIHSKNVYAKRSEENAEVVKNEPNSTIVITPEEKGHNIGLIIAILLTILLGAGVGALIYLIFF